MNSTPLRSLILGLAASIADLGRSAQHLGTAADATTRRSTTYYERPLTSLLPSDNTNHVRKRPLSQRQRRKNRRRLHAAGVRGAFRILLTAALLTTLGCSTRSIIFTEHGPAFVNASFMRNFDEDHYLLTMAGPHGPITLESRTLGQDEQGVPKTYIHADALKSITRTTVQGDVAKHGETEKTTRRIADQDGKTSRRAIEATQSLGNNPAANPAAIDAARRALR